MNNGSIEITLTAERECKHSRRFKETPRPDGTTHIGTLYIQRASPGCAEAAGYKVTLTPIS